MNEKDTIILTLIRRYKFTPQYEMLVATEIYEAFARMNDIEDLKAILRKGETNDMQQM